MLEKEISQVREKISKWKKEGLKVGFVPTMGALHEGHLSLIKKSVQTCDKTVVSIFVNPAQFGPCEDLDKYPKTLMEDLELCKKAHVDLVFAPSVEEMYPQENKISNDFFTYVIPPYFYVDKLCGKTRTGHFDGVCTVVTKLFNIIQPDFAFFGQKDFQQLVIIKKMVQDLNIPTKIVSCPIIRDESGLALSSRNKYLSQEGKKQALVLNKILNNIRACYNKGIKDINALKETAFEFLNEHHELEYLEFVDKETLEEKPTADDNTVVLIAAKVDKMRGVNDSQSNVNIQNNSVRGVNDSQSNVNIQNNSVRLIDNCFIN